MRCAAPRSPPRPNAPLDREAVRAFFSTPVTRVDRQVNASRRSNRRFVHVQLEVDDIRRLSEAAPFAWSTYDFKRDGDLYVYRQAIGPAAGKDVGDVGWTGTGDRRVPAAPAEQDSVSQHRAESTRQHPRLGTAADASGCAVPLVLDARMDPESILYRTLWLFGWTFVAVAMTFGLVIWWIVRRAPAEKRAA